jgi:hypothetical protein
LIPLFAASWAGPAKLLFSLLFHLGFFFLPGVALCCLWPKARSLWTLMVLPLLLGYLSFWIFFASKPAGKLFSFSLFLVSAAVVLFRRSAARRILRRYTTPLLLIGSVAFLHLSLFAWYGDPQRHNVGLANHRFTSYELPGDNVIPYLLAGRIYSHQPLRPFCCGGWLSSDRPPLQAGVALLLEPVRPFSFGEQYQVVGTLLQCLWLGAAWSALRSFGLPARVRLRALLLVAITGFAFFNAAFVWSKLLGAALMLLALQQLRQAQWVRMATSISLSFLAHPGSLISLPVFFLFFGSRKNLRSIPVAAGTAVLLAGPWFLYQKLVDPPGNHLTKMHLAGVMDFSNRDSIGQAVAHAYSSTSIDKIAYNKASNYAFLVGNQPWRLATLLPSNAESLRVLAFNHLVNALGLMNIGWLFLLRVPRHTRRLLFASLASLAIWCLLLLGPNGSATAHLSYTDVLLIAIPLAVGLVQLPTTWRNLVFAFSLFVLMVDWVLSPGQPFSIPFVLVSMLPVGFLCVIFVQPAVVAIPRKALSPRPAR